MQRAARVASIATLLLVLCACGKSADQVAQERSRQEAQWKADVTKAAAERDAENQRAVEAMIGQHQQNEAEQAAALQHAQAEKDASRETDWKERVKNRLLDPASAQFRNVRLGFSQMCGEVNSRNKMGGYGGFKGFVVTNDEVVIDNDEDPVAHEAFVTLAARVVC